MKLQLPPSDIAILDLLRKQGALDVAQLSKLLKVTANAVRIRLGRLSAQGLIDRTAVVEGRGRPRHEYVLTKAGRKQSGANFGDLAVALWEEIRSIEDPEIRSGLLQRISKRLAEQYADQIEGETLQDKLESLSQIFNEREIPFGVEMEGELPILNAHACPYPDLAEKDRSICSVERLMFAELLGESVKLSQCRLDGDTCCTFEPRKTLESPASKEAVSSDAE